MQSKKIDSLTGLIFLPLYMLAGLVYALSNLLMDGYDLVIYREVARMALDNSHPYSHPYADFPPLKLLIFTLVEQAGGLAGWYWFMVGLYMLFGLAAYAFISTFFQDNRLMALIGGLAILFLPGIYGQYWLQLYEDKVVYVVLILALLIFMRHRHPIAASLIMGLLQGYGGFGIVMFPALLVWWWYHQQPPRTPKALLQVVLPFVLVSVASHLLYFPDWITGYQLRSVRTTLPTPAHTSLFQIPFKLWGLYHPWLPNLFTFGGVAAAYFLLIKKRSDEKAYYYAPLLIYFSWLAFGPEAGYDRILAAALPLILFVSLDSFKFSVFILTCLLFAGLMVPVYPAEPLALITLWVIPVASVFKLLLAPLQQVIPLPLPLTRTPALKTSQLKVIDPDRLGWRSAFVEEKPD